MGKLLDGQAEIAVIGGRIASLACAIRLASCGHHVTIYTPRTLERYTPNVETTEVNGDGEDSQYQVAVEYLTKHGVPIADDTLEAGRLVHKTLAEQCRRWEVAGNITRWEQAEILDFVLDAQGACKGVAWLDTVEMEPHIVLHDAVVIATGKPPLYGQDGGEDDYAAMLRAFLSGARWVDPQNPGGGLEVDMRFETSVKNLFATGECINWKDQSSKGAGFYLANVAAGFRCADCVMSSERDISELGSSEVDGYIIRWKDALNKLWGGENANAVMAEPITPSRFQAVLLKSLADTSSSAEELRVQFDRVRAVDRSEYSNTEYLLHYRLSMMLPAYETVIAARKGAALGGGPGVIAEWLDGNPLLHIID